MICVLFIFIILLDSKLNDILPDIKQIGDKQYRIEFVPILAGNFSFHLTNF